MPIRYTCSPLSPDPQTSMPENQGTTLVLKK